jgi:hypothetical protein
MTHSCRSSSSSSRAVVAAVRAAMMSRITTSEHIIASELAVPAAGTREGGPNASLKRADETSETSPARRLAVGEDLIKGLPGDSYNDLNQRDLTTACTTPLPARSQRAGALSVPILGPCAVRAALAPGWPSESAPSAITAPSNDRMKLTRHRRMSRRHKCRLRRTCRPKIGARPVSSP